MIGKIAAGYVEDGDTIILDAGATTSNMTRFLRQSSGPDRDHQFDGNIPYLHTYPNIELIMTGGTYDRETKMYTGRGAHLLLNDTRADKAFIAAEGRITPFWHFILHRQIWPRSNGR